MQAKHVVRSLMLASFTLGGTEMFGLALLARQQQLDKTGLSASALYACGLAGAACMGLAGGRLFVALRPSAIGISVPSFCALMVFAAYLLGPGPADFWITGLVALATALDFPNINSTLNAVVSAKERSSSFSALHSSTNIILVAAPVASAGLISLVGSDVAMLAIAAVYLVSATPWLWMPNREPHAKAREQDASPFVLIVMREGLRGLMLCRILSSLIYTGINVALPYLLSRYAADHDTYVWLQASSLTFLRSGLLAASLIGVFLLAKRPALVIAISIFAPILAAFAAVILALSVSPFVTLTCCLLAGIGQYGSRLTGMVLGPSVTPPSRLAEVILASDTLVRLSSAGYGMALVSIFAHAHGSGLPLAVAALCGLPAPLFLGRAFRSYKRQLRSSENAI